MAQTPVKLHPTPWELGNGNTTATYHQAIGWYAQLARAHPKQVNLTVAGMTDAGLPLHAVVVSANSDSLPHLARKANKAVVLLNNGIHPGEPEGIDASMLLVRKLVLEPEWSQVLDSMTLVVVPVYNVGGCLNRSGTSRVNQNGPQEYGFRGNAQNLDLNRDCIKMDSRNMQALAGLFARWRPQVFIDTHTSNGADYPYTMTLLHTQPEKLGGQLAVALMDHLLPPVREGMKREGDSICPYVVTAHEVPDSGLLGFMDTPRYSSGYAALHQCIGLVPETHMLKPFPRRVESTLRLLQHILRAVARHSRRLQLAQQADERTARTADSLNIDWALDSLPSQWLPFAGYRACQQPSSLTGGQRLCYDSLLCWRGTIPYWSSAHPTRRVQRPWAYYLPVAWQRVAERLLSMGAQLDTLTDTLTAICERYRIEAYHTPGQPFEGHYLHYATRTETQRLRARLPAHGFLVRTDQPAVRAIVESLEPEAPDSYFNWGFFDAILQQKEGYSAYVFEDVALQWLETDSAVRAAFYRKKQQEPRFAADPRAQLDWLYRHSPWYEREVHRIYPVLRVMEPPDGWGAR